MTDKIRPEANLRAGEDAMVQPVAGVIFVELHADEERTFLIQHPNGVWEFIGGKSKATPDAHETPRSNAYGEVLEEVAHVPTDFKETDLAAFSHHRVVRPGRTTLDIHRFLAVSPFFGDEIQFTGDADCTGMRYIDRSLYEQLTAGTIEMEMRAEVRADLDKLFASESATGSMLNAATHTPMFVKTLFINDEGTAVFLPFHHTNTPEKPMVAMPIRQHGLPHHLHHTLAEQANKITESFVDISRMRQKKVFLGRVRYNDEIAWLSMYVAYEPDVAALYNDGTAGAAKGIWFSVDLKNTYWGFDEIESTRIAGVVPAKYQNEITIVMRQMVIDAKVQQRYNLRELLRPLVPQSQRDISIVLERPPFVIKEK